MMSGNNDPNINFRIDECDANFYCTLVTQRNLTSKCHMLFRAWIFLTFNQHASIVTNVRPVISVICLLQM